MKAMLSVHSLIQGDACNVIPSLPDDSAQVVITSPPYYKLRQYSGGDPAEIGREASDEEYVSNLVRIFSLIHSKLKEDGLVWLNLGDTYKNGNLLGIPWRVALAMQKFGWILRSDIVWNKPNAMPSSVKTRPTTAHEYIFMFAKTPDYYYNADAIREPHVTFSEKSRMRGGRNHFGIRGGTPEAGKNAGNSNLHTARWDQAFHPLGRNKRTVWDISLSKYPGAHFAVYPEKLVETCLLASTQEGDCVLDPFAGSGTTGVVAKRFGRQFVGIELVPHYYEIALRRLDTEQSVLF